MVLTTGEIEWKLTMENLNYSRVVAVKNKFQTFLIQAFSRSEELLCKCQDFFKNPGLCMNPRIIILYMGEFLFNNLQAKKVTLILVLQHD